MTFALGPRDPAATGFPGRAQPYLRRRVGGCLNMSTALAAGSAAVRARAWAHQSCSRSAALREQAATERQRTAQLSGRLAANLIGADRPPFGDRGDRYLL